MLVVLVHNFRSTLPLESPNQLRQFFHFLEKLNFISTYIYSLREEIYAEFICVNSFVN